MEDTNEYYLSVSREEAKAISETVSKLYGFMVGFVHANVDPEHGPSSEIAEMMDEAKPIMEKLHKALGDQYAKIQDQNKVVEQSKREMVNDIMHALTSDSTGLDLITKLNSTLNNYVIIGKQQFTNGPGNDEDWDNIPF